MPGAEGTAVSVQPSAVPQHVPNHPGPSSAGVSSRMSAQRRRGTTPELLLRRRLHAAGLRFRVQHKVPGAPRRSIDVAFTRIRLAVFVDGCFWHGCPEHGNSPVANAGWWQRKIAANQARDRDTDRLLRANGWHVLRVWEHEQVDDAARRVIIEHGRLLDAWAPMGR